MSYGTLINTQTIGAGGAASIDFTSIPQTYTDLVLVYNGRSSNATGAQTALMSFNSSTASFSERRLYGNGSSASSDSVARELGIVPGSTATASTFSSSMCYIPNYAGATNKAFSVDCVSENNGTTGYQLIYAGLWSNTSAITSISITLDAGNHVQYSTASLYGIK